MKQSLFSKYSFGSDNHSGVHPKILKAIEKVNVGYSFGYGDDPYTQQVLKKVEKICGGDCRAFFVLNGTGANVISLASFLSSFSAILAPQSAHIIDDECGAVERFSGCRIIPLEMLKDINGETCGKVDTQTVKKFLNLGDQHKVQPIILSISQPTENETLYSVDEIKSLAELMHKNGGYIHVDGSRISNACSAMNMNIDKMIAKSGVDILSFGGTKNGLLIGEAVVVFNQKKNKNIIESLKFFRKQSTQLYSKNRFIAAQFDAYLENDLYLQMAAHSNSMAKYLENKIRQLGNITITKSVDTNAVYLILPFTQKQIQQLQKKYLFYIWDNSRKECRLMCSFNTTTQAIDSLVSDIKKLL